MPLIRRLRSFVPPFVKRLYGYLRLYLLPPEPSSCPAIDTRGSSVPCQVEAYFLALNRRVDEGALAEQAAAVQGEALRRCSRGAVHDGMSAFLQDAIHLRRAG